MSSNYRRVTDENSVGLLWEAPGPLDYDVSVWRPGEVQLDYCGQAGEPMSADQARRLGDALHEAADLVANAAKFAGAVHAADPDAAVAPVVVNLQPLLDALDRVSTVVTEAQVPREMAALAVMVLMTLREELVDIELTIGSRQ